MKIPNFSSESLPDEFNSFIRLSQARAAGYIIDVRGNSGGNAYYGVEVLSHFCRTQMLTSLQSRFPDVQKPAAAVDRSKLEALYGKEQAERYDRIISETMEDIGNTQEIKNTTGVWTITIPAVDQPQVLSQPVVILTDSYCGSAGDDFAALAKNDRFTLIGSNTRGSTGQLATYKLSGGGELGMSTRETLYADGKPIRNMGVPPDIEVVQTADDYLRGVDTVLEYSIAYLTEHIKSPSP